MSTNKHAVIRYQALDSCFRNVGRKFFIDDLIEFCSNALYKFSGNDTGVKRRQIFDDINFMISEEGYNVPLSRFKDGRKVYYRYSDTSFTINKQPLNEAEAIQLKEALLTLSRFKGMPQFEWVTEMITRLESSFNLVGKGIEAIGFEQNEFLIGLEHITTLYHAITYKKSLYVIYKGFRQQEPTKMSFHPYYLKQYNNRWFVFGKNTDFENLSNLALDRIASITETEDLFDDKEIDFQEYFEDIIGVSRPDDLKVEKVKLEVKDRLLPYVKSKPIHGSQRILEETSERCIVQIEVMLNYELESLILSYGSGVVVLEPEQLKKNIKDKIHQSLLQYDF